MKVRQLLASALLLAVFSVAAFAQGRGAGGTPSADELWPTVREANDAGLLEAFITGFPESRHIPEARKRLAALKPGSGTAVTAPSAQPLPPKQAERPSSATATTRRSATGHEQLRGAGSSSSTAFRTERFGEPRQGSQASTSMRVDWCLRWANACGKPAADAFCRSQGFDQATSFENELTGGPTWVLHDEQICAMKDCRALKDVQCEGFETTKRTMPVKATIEEPRINGIALSACLHRSRGCGQEAASAYCLAAGFARAASFGEGNAAQSIHLGDRSLCSGPQCRRITHVVCSR